MAAADRLTDVQRRTLEALRARPVGPAYLSGCIWPDHVALRKGKAPGTGLVRPMLAVLARLKKAGLVRWYSVDDAPVVWDLTSLGAQAIGVGVREQVEIMKRGRL